MRLRLGATLGGLALGALFLSAVPGSASTHAVQQVQRGAAGTSLTIAMTDRSLRASARTVPSGKVTFVVRNAGTMEHEFVVIKTNKSPTALPMKGQQASEAGSKGEIEEFAPGKTRRLTLDLAPGKYVLLCNLPGHYKRGQVVGITVTAGATTAPQATRVTVSAFEMGFKLSRTTVPHGTVTFAVDNDGKIPHDFSFGSKGGGTPLLQPGQPATLTVTFTKPGKYTFICTVEGHAEGGMIGVLTVT